MLLSLIRKIGLFNIKKDSSSLLEKCKQLEIEIKELKIKLQQKENLSSLGAFATGIAHEINNPLSGILNCTRSLLQDKNLDKEVQHYLELIFKGLIRIENIVKQILIFSGKPSFHPALNNINWLIQDTVNLVKGQFLPHNINIFTDLQPLPNTFFDPNQIQQVFLNILKNSADAIKQNGNITIATSEENTHLKITFEDTGGGIKDEIKEKIFEPFFSTKEMTKGVGLGLSVSRGIINNHGGEINIESEEGRGSKVIICLPKITEDR